MNPTPIFFQCMQFLNWNECFVYLLKFCSIAQRCVEHLWNLHCDRCNNISLLMISMTCVYNFDDVCHVMQHHQLAVQMGHQHLSTLVFGSHMLNKASCVTQKIHSPLKVNAEQKEDKGISKVHILGPKFKLTKQSRHTRMCVVFPSISVACSHRQRQYPHTLDFSKHRH